ncbi:thioredoxin family protein [Gramella sp. KN1008]|uniref:thioredoxin family protein n=1 Tax=Gramella sp. KN1008 TaxID=2529298 RepID=UPI001040D1A9|nr:thioredoxin family protein [Gramella sp. KN1008]TBW27991.1 thioredoxin family protein [Gramella sp. KN1008]
MRELLLQSLKNSLSYSNYLKLVKDLVEKESTTGEINPDRVKFTALNLKRMQRLNRNIKLSPKQDERFKNLKTRQTWLVILESWCADGAQTIPILNKIAEASENIDLRIVMRDENPELMDNFLTNGTRSIPKLIIMDQDLEVLATWGPRSAPATRMVTDYKNEFGKIDASFKAKLQVWYNKDKGLSIINELCNITGRFETDLSVV